MQQLARPPPPPPPLAPIARLRLRLRSRPLPLWRGGGGSLSCSSTPAVRTFCHHGDDHQPSSTYMVSGTDECDDPGGSSADQGSSGEFIQHLLLNEEEDERAVDLHLHSVKDVLDAAAAKEQQSGSGNAKLHDFCLGIPYGALLVVSGIALFILTGSAAAVQLGLLGGLLLILSVSSLNTWKKGKSSMSYIQGQAAISLVIFVVELQKVYQTGSLLTLLAVFLSGAMFGFYCYIFLSGGNPPPKKEKVRA